MNIHDAAQNGDLQRVHALINDGGISINSVNKDGATPIHHAAYAGQFDMVSYLCREGADVNQGNSKGYTPLMVASRQGRSAVVRKLVEHDAFVNAADNEGFTALIMGAGYSQEASVVPCLLKAEADVNARTASGGTALLWAAWFGRTENVKALVNAGADLEIAMNGKTPLMLAVEKGFSEIGDLLS